MLILTRRVGETLMVGDDVTGRGGRVAEGAPLLREYRVCSPIEGSNPSLSAILYMP